MKAFYNILVFFGMKPAECPYCHGSNITAHAGHAECLSCDQEWSY